MYMTIVTAWMVLGVAQVTGLVGYDCGAPHLNVTTISLLSVGQCNLPEGEPQVTKTHIQLLQISKFDRVTIITCKISVFRIVYYCGMHSHVSMITNGQADYVTDVTLDQCKEMHQTGTLTVDATHIIRGLKVNHTTSRPMTLAGSLTSDGACEGAQYSDPFGTWSKVVVQGSMTITLQQYTAPVDLETDSIHLHSGTTCKHTDGRCTDFEGAHAFWNTLPINYCKFNQYDLLYEGIANKMVDTVAGQPQIVYSLNTKDITFALAQRGEEPLCGYTLIKTEHPKLLILEVRKGEGFASNKRISVENLDIFTYINSKFVYVEKHLKTQMNRLYRDVLKQRCLLEQQVLKNGLGLAADSPDEFAYHLMKGPGYMAVIAGEVVHVIKCVPVNVRAHRLPQCHQELPVLKGNDSYYLSPKTHILMKTGTQVNCNRIIPVMYYLSDGWYKVTPNIENALTPITMEPMTTPTWHYTNPASLATSGIYSEEDMESLRDHIMFPVEKPAVLNTMARGVSGHPIANQGLSISHLMDQDTLNKLAKTTFERVWGGFISFGTTSAGLIGAYLCGRIIKLLIDTVIHGYALHTLYGWSIYLIGAIWDSVTNLLLHLGKGRMTNIKPEQHEGIPLQTVQVNVENSAQPSPVATNNQITSNVPENNVDIPIDVRNSMLYPSVPQYGHVVAHVPFK